MAYLNNITDDIEENQLNIISKPPINPDYFYYVFYSKIFFFIIGIIGNILCIIIWTKPNFLKMSRSSTCIVLAVVDLIYLLLMVISATIKNYTGQYNFVL